MVIAPWNLPRLDELELDDPADDLDPCEWVGHCPCYHYGDQCCSCGKIVGDDIDESTVE